MASEEPEAILGDLDLDRSSSDSDSESDHVTTPIKYEEINTTTTNEVQNDQNTQIVSKIEISDIQVDFGGSQNDLIATSRVKVEKEVQELKNDHEKSTGSRDFSCEDCIRFLTKQSLRVHVKSHKAMPCQVEGCSIVSYTQKCFYRHRKTHNVGLNGEQIYPCAFPGCSKVFKSDKCLNSHKWWSHNPNRPKILRLKPGRKKYPDRPFICEKCGKSFESNYNLKVHIRLTCSTKSTKPTSTYPCTFQGCSKLYKSKSTLKRHEEWDHQKIKIPESLIKHPDRPFICDKCGRNYETLGSLKVHIKNVCSNSSNYPCTFGGCDRIFKLKGKLTRHLKVVHDRIKNHECEFCGTKFATRFELDAHYLRRHLELLPKKDRDENEKKLDKLRKYTNDQNLRRAKKKKVGASGE